LLPHIVNYSGFFQVNSANGKDSPASFSYYLTVQNLNVSLKMELKNKFMKKKSCVLCAFLFCQLFIFSSCNSSPSESLAIDHINDLGNKGNAAFGANLFKVRSLKKTNGTFSDNQYKMEYTYEIECLKSNGGALFGSRIACDEAGKIVKGNGKLYFEKTENGWIVIDSMMINGNWW
jgi:hypothetical protein